jgi:hypothetical protein
MGVLPAHIRCIPPPRSSNQWWSMSGTDETDVLFEMDAIPPNTFIDVTVELRLVETENPTAGDVPAGAILGRLYGDYLDGITGSLCQPVGFTALP